MNEQTIHILLVEDEEAHADLVRRAFESQASPAHLTVAGSLREARACLVESWPDLVIADWVLPDGRGTELLLAEGEVRHFPVVVMTSQGDEQVAVEAMRAGALDYMVKSAAMLADMPRIAEHALREWGHITARRQAEEALRESEKRRVLATDAGQVGVWDWNLETDEIYLDSNLKAMLGYADHEIRNHLDDWGKHVHPDDVEQVMAEANAHLEGLTPHYEIAHRMLHKDGSIRWFLARGTAMRDANGKPYRVVGTDTDITERKRAEEALKKRTDALQTLHHIALDIGTELEMSLLLRRIIEAATGLLDADMGGCIYLYQPDRGELVLVEGVGPDEDYVGYVLRPGEGLAGSVFHTRRPCSVEDYRTWEGRATIDDDFPFTAMLSVPLLWQGQAIGVLQLNADRHRRTFGPEDTWLAQLLAAQVSMAIKNAQLFQEVETYSHSLEDMVEERTQELREAQEQLIQQERMAVLGRLAGGVAHELRNPLAVISNAVYYLKMVLPDADETVQEYLDIVGDEVRNSTRIIFDLLDFSRIRFPGRGKIAIPGLIAAVLEKNPPPGNVDVITEIPSDLPFVYVDPRQIDQVLANLVTNAYQAMQEGGALTISAQAEEGGVALSVIDTGRGISPGSMARLFEPLFTTRARGIGLGLVISKNLVEANEGSIEVTSEVGKGSTLTVRLPVAAN